MQTDMQPDSLTSASPDEGVVEGTGAKVIDINDRKDRKPRKHKQQTEATRARAMVELIAGQCNRQTVTDPIARFLEIMRPDSPRRYRQEIVTLLSDDYGYSTIQVRAYLTHFHDATFTVARIKRLVIEMSDGADAGSLGARATKLLLEGKVRPADVKVPRARVAGGANLATSATPSATIPQVTRLPSSVRGTSDPAEEGMTMDERLEHRRQKERLAAIEARLPMELTLINRDRVTKGLPEFTVAEFRVKQGLPELTDS